MCVCGVCVCVCVCVCVILRQCAASRKVAGLIPDGISGIFH